jgi:hypothetical protein
MNATIKIHRYKQDKNQTSGSCVILDEFNQPLFVALSLERGWRNNENNVSCIPKGTYEMKLEFSNRFKMDLWEIKGVPNRSETKFHAANYWNQLEGCIALGLRASKLNTDEYMDITNSNDTMKAFHMVLKNANKVKLIIIGEQNVY